MPRIFGYGEDALTLWVLTSNLREFLNRLDDSSDPEQCKIFYRPSFGRRGGNKSAEFGEFDAIVSNPKSIYLIESKWDGSPELDRGKLVLRKEQIERHKVLRYYIESWTNSACESWKDYYAANKDKFESKFSGKPCSPVGSRLSENLQFVLRTTCDSQKTVKDILLYICQSDSSQPKSVKPENFKLVVFEYNSLNNCGIFEMLL